VIESVGLAHILIFSHSAVNRCATVVSDFLVKQTSARNHRGLSGGMR